MSMRRIALGMLVILINHAGPVAAQQATTTGNQSPAIVAGGNVTIGLTSEQVTELATKLVQQMLARGAPQVGPGAEQRVDQAVTAIAKGASEGDEQLQQALSLLAAGNVAQATPLLKAVADNKTARIQKDRKEAATAYRNLGAIAGLRDPKAALDAYAKAAELDPDDAESLFWAGSLEVEHGELGSAEARLRRVLSLTAGQDWYQYWAQVTLADINVQRGDLPGALTSYRDSFAIAERLAKADPGNALWQRDLSVSYNRIGDVLVSQDDRPGALKSYRDGLAIAERLAKAAPGNADWQRDLSISYNKVGDVLMAQGDLPGALKSYRDSFAIAERLAKADPGNALWQRDLSVTYDRIGNVLVLQGDLSGALTFYRDGLAIAERLAKSDPGDTLRQRDLSMSLNIVGNVLVSQGDRPGALTSYRDSLAIVDRLAKSDPGNADWQRDLSISYERVGNVLVSQGGLSEALTSYRDSLAIAERLAKSDPGNADWQRDLSISYNKVGDVLVSQGDLPGALKSYRDGLAIAERLAKADPGNAQWQIDVVVSNQRLASAGDDAMRRWTLIVETLRGLSAANKLTVEQTKWLPVAEENLAKLKKR
jgi:tetratricopeptide (TPR) repeat protein